MIDLLKKELQNANQKHRNELKRADEYKKKCKVSTDQLSDTRRKLDQALAKSKSTSLKFKKEIAHWKQRSMLAIRRSSTQNYLNMRIPDADTVDDCESDKDSLLGSDWNLSDRSDDSKSDRCDLQAENARLKQDIENLRLRIQILEMKSCEQWYDWVNSASNVKQAQKFHLLPNHRQVYYHSRRLPAQEIPGT